MPQSPLNIAVLFSGEGTTLQNLIDATRDGRLPNARVVKAVSSRENVGGIRRCEAAGVPCAIVPKKAIPEATEHTKAVFSHLPANEVDLICLAGWMSQLVLESPWLDNRVMNVHPSLLPAFGGAGMYGRRVHEAVLARGCKVTGCTVHYVNNELDGGPIVSQTVVNVEPDDDADRLAQRVQAIERESYIAAVRQHAQQAAAEKRP